MLNDESKSVILSSIGQKKIKDVDNPVILKDSGAMGAVLLTDTRDFGLYGVDQFGVWDIKQSKKGGFLCHHEICCLLHGDKEEAFAVTKESDPEFIEQVKLAIQLGRL